MTVQVRTGCGEPVPGAVVRFSVTSGAIAPAVAGLTGGATSVDITTAAPDGTAKCWWRLGGEIPVQTLAATLLARTAPDPSASPLTFVAGVADDGINVTGVVAGSGAALPNNAALTHDDLASGLTVQLDRPPDDPAAIPKPLQPTATLDLPLAPAARRDWGWQQRGGLVHDAGVALPPAGPPGGASPAVTWTAADTSRALLANLFGVLAAAEAGDRVLGHLALDRRVAAGAGYAQWFWLVAAVRNLVLVPHLQGKLQLPSGREMMAHVVSRDDIRAIVWAWVQVSDQPTQDLEAARQAADRLFGGAGAISAG